ncbi:MAG: hypothetical protein ACYDD7_05335 [Acidimicrobiales bacterium]
MVRDCVNRRPCDQSSAGCLDEFLHLLLRYSAPSGVGAVPEFDFDSRRALLSDNLDLLTPPVQQTGLPNPVLRSPSTQCAKVLKHCLEWSQAACEADLRVGLPKIEESNELRDRLGIRHDHVERLRHQRVGRLAILLEEEVVVRLQAVLCYVSDELETGYVADGPEETINRTS